MKELTIEHLTLVAGGIDTCGIGGAMGFGGAIKGGQEAGKVFALQAGWGEGNAIATKTARLGGFAGMSFAAGFIGGTCLYEHSETVRETAIGMMESLHLRYGDQSGNDYGNTNTTNKDGNAYGG